MIPRNLLVVVLLLVSPTVGTQTQTITHSVYSNDDGAYLLNQRRLLRLVNVFGSDDRVVQTRRNQAFGYAAIGRFYTSRIFTDAKGKEFRRAGTGFLVSPCVALTNYHVIFGSDKVDRIIQVARELNRQFRDNRDAQGHINITVPNDIDYSMTFMVGERPDGTFKWQVLGRPVAFGNMDKQGGEGSDWAAIKFDEPSCPGSDSEIGWLDLVDLPYDEMSNLALETAGYPVDRNHNRTINHMNLLYRTSRVCHSFGQFLDEDAFVHDCSMTEGDSGSPVYFVDHGHFNVVGLNAGSASEEEGRTLPNFARRSEEFETYENRGPAVKAFLQEVLPIIARDTAAHRRGGAPAQLP
jgi:V8-like Glu-specific endopeptidase